MNVLRLLPCVVCCILMPCPLSVAVGDLRTCCTVCVALSLNKQWLIAALASTPPDWHWFHDCLGYKPPTAEGISPTAGLLTSCIRCSSCQRPFWSDLLETHGMDFLHTSRSTHHCCLYSCTAAAAACQATQRVCMCTRCLYMLLYQYILLGRTTCTSYRAVQGLHHNT